MSPATPAGERVLVLTPVKQAARRLDHHFATLGALDFPKERISLGLLDSDSDDGTFAALRAREPTLAAAYRRVTLLQHDYGFRLPPGVPRWDPSVQLARRAVLARSRNRLLSGALRDEDWVLWLDVDLESYPPDVLARLLATGKDVVTPHCVKAPGGETFDRNAWREHGRVRLDVLRGGPDVVPLDAVGGTMLLVRADLHRDGLVFPPYPYGDASPLARRPTPLVGVDVGEIETEGLGLMAHDMGHGCWGMPNLEIVHADA